MMKKKVQGLFGAFLSLATSIFAADLYVNPEDGGTFTGEGVYATLNEAVTAAADGDVIHLQNGFYPISKSVNLSSAVTVVSDGESDTTIVYAPASISGRFFNLSNSGASVRNITVLGKNREGTQTSFSGAFSVADGKVLDCVIASHRTTDRGGAIHFSGSGRGKGLADRCIITNNFAKNGGGGVCFFNGGTLRNSLLLHNSADQQGGALFFWTNAANAHNCTMAYNKSNTHSSQASIRFNNNNPGETGLRGCILYENYDSTGGLENNPHSSYYKTTVNLFNPPAGIFVNPMADDFHLKTEQARNAGYLDVFTPSSFDQAHGFGEQDLDGNPRASYNMVDYGCYEIPEEELMCRIEISNTGSLDSDEVTLTSTLFGTHTDVVNYSWTITRKGDESFTPIIRQGPSLNSVTETLGVGIYSVRLEAKNSRNFISICNVDEAFIVFPVEVYVNAQGSETPPFNTPEKGIRNLEKVLKDSVNGLTIRVANGKYPIYEPISISKAITISGCGEKEKTILYAPLLIQSYFITVSSPNTLIENLTLQGTNEDGNFTAKGGAVNISSGTLENCIITCFNKTYGEPSTKGVIRFPATGKAMGNLNRCIVTNNTTSGDATIYMSGGTVRSSLIANNTIAGDGSAFFVYESSTAIYNCTVVNNNSTKIGTHKQPTIRTNNNTPEMRGNIFFGNTITNVLDVYSNTGYISPSHNVYNPDETIFNNTQEGDYALSSDATEYIDRFLPTAFTQPHSLYDLAGNPRFIDEMADMGCYETLGNAITAIIELSRDGGTEKSPISFMATVVGNDIEDATIRYDIVDTKTSETAATQSGTALLNWTVSLPAGDYLATATVIPNDERESVTTAPIVFAVYTPKVYIIPTGEENPYGLDIDGMVVSSIAEVLSKAEGGITICLTNGYYRQDAQIELSKAISIVGIGNKEEIFIHPMRSGSYFISINHPAARLEGVTITGNGKNGQRVDTYGAVITFGTINNCIFTNLKGGSVNGVGVYMRGGSVLNTTFKGLRSYDGLRGLAIYEDTDAHPILIDGCTFEDGKIGEYASTFTSRGSGVFLRKGTIQRSLFRNNNGQYGSAICIEGAGTVRSCVFEGNHSSLHTPNAGDPNGYGTIYSTTKNCKIENCTIINNTVAGDGRGNVAGVQISSAPTTPSVVNCIIVGNKNSNGIERNVMGVAEESSVATDEAGFSHCATTEGYGQNPISPNGTFRLGTIFPYRITRNNPWRNSGLLLDWHASSTDFYGFPRLYGRGIDLGACESPAEHGTIISVR